MRNLHLFLILLTLPLTRTLAIQACGTELRGGKYNNSYSADCPSCKTISDYALTGSALVESQRLRTFGNYTSYSIKVNNGKTSVSVNVRLAKRDVGVSILGYGFEFLEVWDRSAQMVTAYALAGSPEGFWAGEQRVPTITSKQKCELMEEEAEAREKAEKERERSTSSEGGGQSGSNGGSSYRVPYFGGYYTYGANDDRIPVVTSYECYGGGCGKTGAIGKPLRAGSSRIYRLAD